MAPRLQRTLLLLALSPLPAIAQPSVPLLQPPLHPTTPEAFRAHLDSLQQLVGACRSDPHACDPAAIGDDDRIDTPGDPYQVRWQWLRKLIDDARNPALPDRATLLDQASSRLDRELAAASAPPAPQPAPQPAFDQARRTANAILARPEFRIVKNQSWLDREIAAFWNWFDRLFTAASDFGKRSPWLGPLLEWSFVGLAIVAVLIWVRRTLQRQALAIALSGPAPSTNWQQESAEWAGLAQSEAELGRWREAIHCLYWAAIVALERRRLWSRNYARTPREYLPLLEANSPQQIALRALTGLFERIWYGLRGAAPEDYALALALFEDLKRA
jgi:hypothetical protein